MIGRRTRRRRNAEHGATVEEYALMVTFGAVFIITILVQYGAALAKVFGGALVGL
jgi:Flp pilus assembly pilin Flp